MKLPSERLQVVVLKLYRGDLEEIAEELVEIARVIKFLELSLERHCEDLTKPPQK